MIAERFFARAEAAPERPFLVFGGQTTSYGEMVALVTRCAEAFAAEGIGVGDHVAMLCGNRPAYLVAWFALMELGAVTVPLNSALVGEGLRYTLTQSEARVLLIEPTLLAEKRPTLSDLPIRVVEIGEPEETPCEAAPRPQREAPAPSALNSILYTSGTTGQPKGVMIPNGAYAAAGDDMSAALQLTADDRMMVFLPLFHANPQMYAVASAVTVGAALILLPKFVAGEFLETAQATGATGFTYVGTVLSLLAKKLPAQAHDHQLRWCVGGGAPLDEWIAIEERLGVAVRELYGMTETGGWVTLNHAGASRRGTVGPARPGMEIAIRALDGTPAAPGQTGQILVRSSRADILTPGYWNKPKATAEAWIDGWLHTGDLGRLDADGFLSFEGRAKELIRRGGEMISPVEIEQALLRSPAVAECAVVAVADAVMGDEILAAIVPAAPIEAEAVVAGLEGQLPRYMHPRYIAFVEALPKTETNKIIRSRVAEAAGVPVDLRRR